MQYGIKEARKRRGWSQELLASMSGVSRATISGLESGRKTIATTETIRKLAKALDENIESIFFN